MPIPGHGEEKKLGKIRQVLENGSYSGTSYSGEPTSLNTAEGGGYGTINQNSPSKPSPSNPAKIDEWSNYDHTAGPAIVIGVNTGCMDNTACNYNSDYIYSTTHPDYACEYTSCAGCTDELASNYDPTATELDNSCEYPPEVVVEGCMDSAAFNYNSNATVQEPEGICNYLQIVGCMDETATNHNEDADVNDPDLCNYADENNADTATNVAFTEVPAPVLGCTDVNAFNYLESATEDDDSCIAILYGCTDAGANNTNSDANTDDGSCTYDVLGCTDSTAINFNLEANTDDGSCVELLTAGCLDETALNYDPTVDLSDPDSCNFGILDTPAGLTQNVSAGPSAFGTTAGMYTGLSTNGFCPNGCGGAPPGAYQASGTNPAMHSQDWLNVGESTGFKLLGIYQEQGGPANDSGNVAGIHASDQQFFRTFIRRIFIYATGGSSNGKLSPASSGTHVQETENGIVKLWDDNACNKDLYGYGANDHGNHFCIDGSEGGYVNSDGSINTWQMLQDHGGQITFRIKWRKLEQNEGQNQGLHADPDYGMFRKATLHFTWTDINIADEGLSCYPCEESDQQTAAGTISEALSLQVGFPGFNLINILENAGCSNEGDYLSPFSSQIPFQVAVHCPSSNNEMVYIIRQKLNE